MSDIPESAWDELTKCCRELEGDQHFTVNRYYATAITAARLIAGQEAAAKYPPELVERLTRALTEVVLELERIDASRATHFGRVGELIVGNRAILAELDALKVDPLVEALRETYEGSIYAESGIANLAREIRESLTARGLHITEIDA